MWEHFSGDKPPLASTSVLSDLAVSATKSVTAASVVPPGRLSGCSSSLSAIRTAIVSDSNTGIKAAATLSSRIASRRTAARKGKGKFDAKAAAKVDQIVFDYLDYLECSSAEELALTVQVDHMYLARVTRVLGGKYMEVKTQENKTEHARIPGHLTAKGSVSHKRHKTHVFGVGDVVIVEHGDIKGKFDSPALLAVMEARFEKIGYVVPAGFFSATKDATTHAAEVAHPDDDGFEFDYSEEAAKLRKKRSLRPKKAAGGAGDADEEEEAPLDVDAI